MNFSDLDHFVFRQRSDGPVTTDKITRSVAIIDGYPRSGNTYVTEIAQFVLKRKCEIALAEQVIHHYHEDLLVDIASKYRIPSVFIIRNPIDAILSCCLYRLNEASIDLKSILDVSRGPRIASTEDFMLQSLIEKECLRYIILYSKLILLWDDISQYSTVICFEDFKDNPYVVVDALFNVMKIKMDIVHEDRELMAILADKTYFTDMVASNAKRDAIPVHQISAPRPAIGKVQEALGDYVRRLESDLMRRATDVYAEIVSHSGKLLFATRGSTGE